MFPLGQWGAQWQSLNVSQSIKQSVSQSVNQSVAISQLQSVSQWGSAGAVIEFVSII